VIDAAAHVFAQQGFHATSVDDLVKATGLQRGGLYHYMDGKKELLIRIHERFLDPLLAEAERIMALGEPPDVTLHLLARALVHDIATYTDQVTVFLHEWRYIQNEPEWADIRRARRRFEACIETVIQAGSDSGMFTVENAHLAMLGFLGMINYIYQWYRPGGTTTGQDIADQFSAIFLSGIRVTRTR
jgi:AcrR family transcriptional regulator